MASAAQALGYNRNYLPRQFHQALDHNRSYLSRRFHQTLNINLRSLNQAFKSLMGATPKTYRKGENPFLH